MHLAHAFTTTLMANYTALMDLPLNMPTAAKAGIKMTNITALTALPLSAQITAGTGINMDACIVLMGAAVEYDDGTKEWWQNGKRHRTDGPAVERSDGYREWWINGVELPVYQDDLNITPQFILSKHIYDSLA